MEDRSSVLELEKKIQRYRGSLSSTGKAIVGGTRKVDRYEKSDGIAADPVRRGKSVSLAQTAAALQTSVLCGHVQKLQKLQLRPPRRVHTRNNNGGETTFAASNLGGSSTMQDELTRTRRGNTVLTATTTNNSHGSTSTTAAGAPPSFPDMPSSGTSQQKYRIAKFYQAGYDVKLSRYKESLNLAQRLEIMEKPQLPVASDAEWNTFCEPVATTFLRDIDKKCPICWQRFFLADSKRPERACVILHPCGHLYHQGCLQSYERFCEGRPLCPVCRKEYADCGAFDRTASQPGFDDHHAGGGGPRDVVCSSSLFQAVATIRIQRMFRGFFSRKKKTWKMFTFSGTPLMFQKTRLGILRRAREQYESSEQQLEAFFAGVDASVGRARDILNDALGLGSVGNKGVCQSREVSQGKWEWAQNECKKRGFPNCECPICFVDFTVGVVKSSNIVMCSNVALLDCGHCFHAVCIESFEKFQQSKTDLKCPVCRQGPYERRIWQLRKKKSA